MVELLGQIENESLIFPQCDQLVIEEFPESIWDQKYQDIEIKDKYKVVYITSEGGENNYSENFKFAAERMGWEVKVYFKETKPFTKEILKFNPDFILFTVFANRNINEQILLHPSKKYYTDFSVLEAHKLWKHFTEQDEKENGVVSPGALEHLSPFDGMTFLFTTANFYEKLFLKMEKDFFGIDMLPSTPALINEPSEPEYLTWCGMGWDKFRSSETFKDFINKLSHSVPMKVYGPSSYLDFLSSGSYDGFTPPGVPHIEAIRKNGMYLLTHSDMYIKAEMPTSRVFEALAANVIIISDMHPFVIKNFADNILYFYQYADSETMFTQVKNHYDWIKANPMEAKLMAGRAHDIFLKKFSIEKDLPRLARMHEYVVANGPRR